MSGIVKDPWRIVTPLKDPEPTVKPLPKAVKKNLGDFDDANEKRDYFDIRGSNGSIRVECRSGDIALKKLILFFRYARHEIGDERLIQDGIGFKAGEDYFNIHDFDSTTSVMSAGEVNIYFVEQGHDEGLSRVVALMIEMAKTHKDLYKKFGIEPIQR